MTWSRSVFAYRDFPLIPGHQEHSSEASNRPLSPLPAKTGLAYMQAIKPLAKDARCNASHDAKLMSPSTNCSLPPSLTPPRLTSRKPPRLVAAKTLLSHRHLLTQRNNGCYERRRHDVGRHVPRWDYAPATDLSQLVQRAAPRSSVRVQHRWPK